MEEKKLAERLSAGDLKSLETVIAKYTAYVCTVAQNFSRGMLTREDIDEIAADVFCKLWSCRGNLSAELGLRPYLSAAVRNAVKNRFRQALTGTDIEGLEIPSDFLVEEAAELREMTEYLYEGLKQLCVDDQEIFFRFYFNGETASRIAAAKGTSKNTVDACLHRIRRKLREYLNERGYYYV